jgi:hypothetical protein
LWGCCQARQGPAEIACPPSKSDGDQLNRGSDARARPVPQDTVALDELEGEIDQLSVRAAAINSSLDRLQQEQARQGLGLRGDIVARQESMKLNLARARDAIENGDAARARRYKDQVERDVQ